MPEIRRSIPMLVVGLTMLGVSVWVSYQFVINIFEQPPLVQVCTDRNGMHLATAVDHTPFFDCVKDKADLFLRADYAEMKDLAKSFLSLLIATLVASITFSEKIVDVSRAGARARTLMVASWLAIFGAILSLGAGLALMTIGAGVATYSPSARFKDFEIKAIPLYIAAGLSFGFGLFGMLLSGVASLFHTSKRVHAKMSQPMQSRHDQPLQGS